VKKTPIRRESSDNKGIESKSRLNGKGQLVFDANGGKVWGKLDAGLVKGRKAVSFEVWFTPTAKSYDWDPVVMFQGGSDAFYYKFRTLGMHRTKLILKGRAENVKSTVDARTGSSLHVVVTYGRDAKDGPVLLSSYVNGKRTGRMVTGVKLADLALTSGQVGPLAGAFDELRIYDYALTDRQVRGNYASGPNKVNLAK